MFLATNFTFSARKARLTAIMANVTNDSSCPHFNFILQPEFPANALILASDALRIANQNSGREIFRWNFVSESGGPVRASNGMWFDVDCEIQTMAPADVVLLFEGNLPTQRNSQALLGQLRASARFGAIVGGVDTGAFALAQAGLIGTGEASELVLHWEAVPTFRERFPTATILNQIYLVQDGRAHCAGGVAALDLVLDLIAGFNGSALANEVANALVHTRRDAATEQRNDPRPASQHTPLSGQIVALMEDNLDFPLTLGELAGELGISQRTLSRECNRMFGESPMRIYLHVRLQAARNILFYEEFSIKEVALACGFSYPALFSRAFRKLFNQTPRDFRLAVRQSQSLAVRPEIRRLIETPGQIS
jgi:AraC family carnitine catabolism transcriptional activator